MWGEETLEYGKEHMIVMKKTMKDHKEMLISRAMQIGNILPDVVGTVILANNKLMNVSSQTE